MRKMINSEHYNKEISTYIGSHLTVTNGETAFITERRNPERETEDLIYLGRRMRHSNRRDV